MVKGISGVVGHIFVHQVEEHKSAYKELMKSAHERQLRTDSDLKRIEKEILEKDDVLNFSFVNLNKCETCGSQIVKIESKIIEVDSDGKKKIKDGKKITEHLIIS